MKTDLATAPLDFVGSVRREDPLEAKRRHFAASTRWARQITAEQDEEDKRRAKDRAVYHALAGLRCGMERTR